MKCKKCKREATGNFCSNCGTPLLRAADLFHLQRKNAMHSVNEFAIQTVGKKNGYSKLGRAAWAIASGRPQDAVYLHGRKAGSEESYVILQEVEALAKIIVVQLNDIRKAYQDGN